MEVGSPFGSQTRTRVLLALEQRGQSYPRELSRLLAVPLSVVQKALGSLERDALVTSRRIGRTRLFQIDPGYVAVQQLRGFLATLLAGDDRIVARAASERPRRRRARRASGDRRGIDARAGRPRRDERAPEERGPSGRTDEWKVW